MNPYNEQVSAPNLASPKEHVCESDGAIYTSNPPQLKCRICGQFKRIDPAPPITWVN